MVLPLPTTYSKGAPFYNAITLIEDQRVRSGFSGNVYSRRLSLSGLVQLRVHLRGAVVHMPALVHRKTNSNLAPPENPKPVGPV